MNLYFEWTSRDATVLNEFIEHYQLQNYIVMEEQAETKKKRMRRRSSSMQKSVSEGSTTSYLVQKDAVARAERMAASSEFARRQTFAGDPLRKARDWIKKEDWENVSVLGSRRDEFTKVVSCE
ncbi:unnamed protein product [Strongylus vulgaris]|uniref:Uncharacterized protein n=1 Tax=Strongylus vulgaris TaxID=40348 RepID=A0A3P7KJP2_STRVU|nr:unnamed protein product [Strongylus vulgaris]